MNALLIILIILSGILIIIELFACSYFNGNITNYKEKMKLTFTMFKNLYAINADAFDCQLIYVAMDTPMEKYQVIFNIPSHIRYLLWLHHQTHIEENEERYKVLKYFAGLMHKDT